VHFHGFPNAGAVFDGVPESTISINMGFSLTYYYKIVEPGTFMYHCHVEASEHMQMGMLGNLYVEPAQNGTAKTYNGTTYTNFVYNDGNGSTGYDTGTINGVANQPLEFPIQIGSMDANFHDEHIGVQPLPFAEMHDDYPMLNGRGYPDTVNVNPLPPVPGGDKETSGVTSANESSQVVHTRIEAQPNKRILLRISNLNVTRFYTLATTGGLRMKVIGTGAHILRGPGGADLSYDTNSVTLGGGESADVLIDTTGVATGTYLLYSTNLEALSNAEEDLGGMMTEIVIN
jgi:FtsP/CotA-like multicopper oxidase with cupredoxin domain